VVEQVTRDGAAPVTQLRKNFEELLKRPQRTPEEVFRVNMEFHRGIVELLGNTLLEEMFDLIWNRALTSGIWARILEEGDAVQKFHNEHAGLIEAIESGNTDLARSVAVEHILGGRQLHEI
jgi:DNA-binding GntR family transcriptional regulator